MFNSAKYWNEKYKKGENISQLMRNTLNSEYNSSEIIEMAYELQSSTYIKSMKDKKSLEEKKLYTEELSKIILKFCEPKSILEAGIGEATTLSELMENFSNKTFFYGFDLSWSRVAYGNEWLKYKKLSSYNLCTGNLLEIPFLDDSIDLVYTSHSIEPNGGKEREILKELYRVTKKYLILLEPGYELTNDENRKRMDSHGYCKNLKGIAEDLGYKVIRHELFKFCTNKLNPTAIIIIEKNKDNNENIVEQPFADPIYKTKLERNKDCFYSPESMSVFPIINGIPCLRSENKILSVKYEELNNMDKDCFSK